GEPGGDRAGDVRAGAAAEKILDRAARPPAERLIADGAAEEPAGDALGGEPGLLAERPARALAERIGPQLRAGEREVRDLAVGPEERQDRVRAGQGGAARVVPPFARFDPFAAEMVDRAGALQDAGAAGEDLPRPAQHLAELAEDAAAVPGDMRRLLCCVQKTAVLAQRTGGVEHARNRAPRVDQLRDVKRLGDRMRDVRQLAPDGMSAAFPLSMLTTARHGTTPSSPLHIVRSRRPPSPPQTVKSPACAWSSTCSLPGRSSGRRTIACTRCPPIPPCW